MTGAEQDFRAALDVANQRHVAACLAQGGFARIVSMPGGGVVHLGPEGLPYRHDPDGRPGQVVQRARGEPIRSTVPEPVLARQRPLTLDRVMMDGVRYRPGRVLALQLLANGGHDAVTVRSLAMAMGECRGAVGTLIVAMVGDGLAARVGSFAGRSRTALYTITDKGRRILAKLTATIDPDPNAVPVLDMREVTVLEAMGGGSATLAKASAAIGLGEGVTRKVLATMGDRGLIKRYRHKVQHRWKVSSRGREALAAAKAGA